MKLVETLSSEGSTYVCGSISHQPNHIRNIGLIHKQINSLFYYQIFFCFNKGFFSFWYSYFWCEKLKKKLYRILQVNRRLHDLLYDYTITMWLFKCFIFKKSISYAWLSQKKWTNTKKLYVYINPFLFFYVSNIFMPLI